MACLLCLALGGGCKTSGEKLASTTPPANTAATAEPATSAAKRPASTQPPADDAERKAELSRIMTELQSLGALDPQAQARLLSDLQNSDPALWPLVVQAFRTSLAYRQRMQASPAEKKQLASAARGSVPADGGIAEKSPDGSVGDTDSESAPEANASATAAPTTTAPQTTTAAASPATPENVQKVSHAVAPDASSKELLKQAIEAMERESQEHPDSPQAVQAQAHLRMLYLAAGRRDDALRSLPGVSSAEQEFWSDQLYALSAYLDHERTPDAGRRAAEAALHLDKASGRLSGLGPLVVHNLAFCTEVTSFGVYTAFPKSEFRPGQQLLLYAEIENFKSEESSKGFHTALRSSYRLLDSQGHSVTDHDLPLTEEYCQNRRRDYFIRYFLSIPARTYDGKYTLQLTIEDTLGHKIGQGSIDLVVKEK